MRVASFLIFFAVLPAAARAQMDTLVTASRIAPGARVTIRNLDGRIHFRPGSGDRVEVRARISARRGGSPGDIGFVVTNRDAEGLSVCTSYQGHGCGDQSSIRDIRVTVDYTITLPKGSAVTANTGNGDVDVESAVTDADLRTGNGDMRVADAANLTANTGNGDVVVAAASGAVRLRTGNGDIEFKGRPVEIDAHSGNGDVIAQIGGPASSPRRLTLDTGAGDVKITLPADIAADLDATSGSGGVTSAFDVRVTGRADIGRLRGVIGAGSVTSIRLRTGAGQVTIVKGS